MVPFRVVAIPDDLARQTRATLKSPQYGQPAHIELAAGYGPCCSCLATFAEGEEERMSAIPRRGASSLGWRGWGEGERAQRGGILPLTPAGAAMSPA